MAQRDLADIAKRDEQHESACASIQREIQHTQVFGDEMSGERNSRGSLVRVDNQRHGHRQQQRKGAKKSRFINESQRLQSFQFVVLFPVLPIGYCSRQVTGALVALRFFEPYSGQCRYP